MWSRHPRRIQRLRSHRRLPSGAVYIGVNSPWANPFLSRTFGHVAAISLHASWLIGRLGALELHICGFNEHEIAALGRLRSRRLRAVPSLSGRLLACWCPVRSPYCHGDALARLSGDAA